MKKFIVSLFLLLASGMGWGQIVNPGGTSYVPATGTSTPQGTTGSPGTLYTQSINGVAQQWLLSPNAAVWTNQTTGAVVYAGANTTTGFSHYYEMNDGTGSATLADSVGSASINVNGGGAGGAPAWNGTNGLSFTNTFFQYAGPIPQAYLVAHSTYFFCVNVAGVPSNPGNNALLGQISGANPQFRLSAYGQPMVITPALPEVALQTVSLNVPTCITYVYNGDGTDQFWIGTVKTQYTNIANSFVAATGNLALGGFAQPYQGIIYKFGVTVGTALAADQIQKNSLVASAKIATDTSLVVPTAPANFQTGNYTLWALGDSRSDQGGNSCAAFLGCVYKNYFGNYFGSTAIPGLTVLNGGTGSQLMANYVSAGIFNQATAILNEITIPGAPSPPHFSVIRMGVNDISSGVSAATLYATYQAAILPLTQNGWNVISMTEPSYAGANEANRLAYNALLRTNGQQAGLIDLANDLRYINPNFLTTFGLFTPYQIDGLHDEVAGASVINGRVQSMMNSLGFLGKGTTYTDTCATAYCDIDMAKGSNHNLILTNNISVLKIINGNQGQALNLTITQPSSGGPYTIPTPIIGSGATATVTSGGVVTLTGGGSSYDQNYMPVFNITGLTCSTYPRITSTITNGAIASIAPAFLNTAAGCSGTGTVTVVSTEPVWINFNSNAVNSLAAGNSFTQSFVFDGIGQSINSTSTSTNATASFTPGTGVTSVTCTSSACTSTRGTISIVGGTATTGTIATVSWAATPTTQVCTATMNGGVGFLGIGNSTATSTGMNITAGVSVLGVTFNVNYACQP